MYDNITIDDVVDNIIDEADIIADFLGYKPNVETLNNSQLLREELEHIAKQMPDEELIRFYNLCQQRAMVRELNNYFISETKTLLDAMHTYINYMKNQPTAKPVIDITTDAIAKIENCIKHTTEKGDKHAD